MTFRCDHPVPGLAPSRGLVPEVLIEADARPSRPAADSYRDVWVTRFPEGCAVRAAVGPESEQRLEFGDRAVFTIAPDASRIAWWAADPSDPSWVRFMLDTVLWWTSLMRGFHLLHASAVQLEEGAVAVVGPSGAGKSTLAAELLRRGNRLLTDDVLALESSSGTVIAHPGPGLMNLPFASGDPHELGRPIAPFPDQQETWVALDRVSYAAAPLTAVFILRRGPGLPLRAERTEATVLDLLPYVWSLPHVPDAARSNFELIGELASCVPVFELTAGPDSSPADLADALERAIRDAPGPRTAELMVTS